MRDYPNMSYTMFGNTRMAMEQLIAALREDGKELLDDMSREEMQAFRDLAGGMNDLCSELQELYEDLIEDSDVSGY